MLNFLTASVIIVPSSVNAELYTLVNFTCEGTGSALYWSVQGLSLSSPSNQNREISVTTNNISVAIDELSSVLTIRALPINDGIIVGCIVVDKNLNIIPHGATLNVKG